MLNNSLFQVAAAFVADRYKMRLPMIMLLLLIAIAGTVLLQALQSRFCS
jgi:hypothetical protein